MLEWVYIIWFFMIPLAIEFAIATVYRAFPFRPKIGAEENIRIVQFTTKEAPYDILKPPIEAVKKYDPDATILVVTDNPNPKKVEGDNVVYLIVPEDYNNGHAKARAMNYALEWKLKHFKNPEKTYTLVLDEENIPSKELLWYLKYYKGYMTVGCMKYARGISLISWLMDGIRVIGDSVYRLVAQVGLPIWHGEHEIIRLDVEASVGWTSGLAEDMEFATKVWEKYKKIDFHPYLAYTISPLYIRDLMYQRRRWILGSLSAIRKLDSWVLRVYYSYRMLQWASGFPAWLLMFIAIPLSVFFNAVPPHYLFPLAFVWYVFYYIGWRFNDVDLKTRIICLPLVLVISALETSVFWYALIRRVKSYQVVKKYVK